MSDWCPFAKVDAFKDGGSFTGGPPKGLLHTTEGSSYAGARSVYASKAVAPHFTASFEGGRFQVWQHVPISKASRALKNASGGVETNRDHVIQIEIVGFASDPRPYHGAFLEGLANLMRWIEDNAGVPRQTGVVFKAPPANGVRLSGPAWDNYSGWCGHQHAPENDHVDPGAIPISALLGTGGDDDLDAAQAAKLDAIYNLLVGPNNTDPDDGAVERIDLKLDGLREITHATMSLCTTILDKVSVPGGIPGSDLDKTALAASLRAMADNLEQG